MVEIKITFLNVGVALIILALYSNSILNNAKKVTKNQQAALKTAEKELNEIQSAIKKAKELSSQEGKIDKREDSEPRI